MPRATKQPRLSCRLGCLCRHLSGANARQCTVSSVSTCAPCGRSFCSPECLLAHQEPGDEELRLKKNCRGPIPLQIEQLPESMVAAAQPGACSSAGGELGSTHICAKVHAFSGPVMSPLTLRCICLMQVFRWHPWLQQHRLHAAAPSRSVHLHPAWCST